VEGIVFTKDDIKRHERERVRNREAGKLHQNRIRRFEKTQRQKREWINFAEIAEWCSELSGTGVPNEAAHENAYRMLERDLLAGAFEEDGRSRVLFLFPGVARARMTHQWLRAAIEHNYDNKYGRSYLQRCWLPRDLFERWYAKHNLPESPQRFQPESVDKGELPAETRQLPSASQGTTGRSSKLIDGIKAQMRADIEAGKADELRDLSKKEMAKRYGGSPNTCKKARDRVFAEPTADLSPGKNGQK
jgi:hypothetical protein